MDTAPCCESLLHAPMFGTKYIFDFDDRAKTQCEVIKGIQIPPEEVTLVPTTFRVNPSIQEMSPKTMTSSWRLTKSQRIHPF